MRFDENADLDTSTIEDRRGGGGGGGGGLGGRVAVGGGGLGIIGLILFFIVSALGGGGGTSGGALPLPTGLNGLSSGQQADGQAIASSCRTGADANNNLDCEVVAVVNSLNGYWSDTFARSGQTYRAPNLVFFNGSVNTGGCGGATSDVGPFYCPADAKVYIDLSFFKELETRFGAQGGPYARAYVIAHEYGHHIQNLLGTSSRVQAGDSGPTSGSVRLELQADCYAGSWGNHATQVPTSSGRPLITDVTQADVNAALDTASRIGDDYIQSNLGGGRVNESQFTHGSSAQREKWYSTGYQTGNPAQCDTFARGVSLG
ncbi:neutral zinc metallopeptidase [Pseudonocardia sp. N23]|uniref:KPN_02809 family neutral zinc metallopeptidase n=1 Tax=Pseudonocardia sp. N23 TaxID=1987376 RepID=UPI000BFCA009|nr:neutral zinc metallopeptidase [Pseudonocardia sp. N23]GAY09170.1 YpfJ protein, zinc metalloprotease superfamily [Pseudonocardia sp. N23]